MSEKIELLTKSEAAEILAVSEDTVERLIRGGQLPAYRIAKTCTRISREDLLVYLDSRRVKAAALRKTGVSMAAVNRQRRARELPCGYKPGMKVVDPNA